MPLRYRDNLRDCGHPPFSAIWRRRISPSDGEVTERTIADRKGGGTWPGPQMAGCLCARSPCPPGGGRVFQDITRHRFFNTNNLWVHLPHPGPVAQTVRWVFAPAPDSQQQNQWDLTRPTSTPIHQLETAMGLAISLLTTTAAISVLRNRFRPCEKQKTICWRFGSMPMC